MKKHFFTGLAIFAPIALTVMIAIYLFDLLTAPFAGIIESLLKSFEGTTPQGLFRHEGLILFLSRLTALVVLFFLILLLGYLGRKFFFNTFLRLTNALFLKIPFVKRVYKISKDVTKAFFTQTEKTFKSTVLVPFPHKDTHAIGFVTGNIPEPLKRLLEGADTAVFVPTAPHPLSGFILMTRKSDILEVDITTEEAFKFLVSCGVSQPGQATPDPDGK